MTSRLSSWATILETHSKGSLRKIKLLTFNAKKFQFIQVKSKEVQLEDVHF
jgi:hypothetical protein